jgi:sugar phosphate isomerase/epimerase
MNKIRVIGQVISCTNYTTPRIFNFNPEPIRNAAEVFLAAGVTEIEIPQGVLDPDNKFPSEGIDRATVKRTVKMLPKATTVLATYLSAGNAGKDNKAFVEATTRTIKYLVEYFPKMNRAMLHPPHIKDMTPAQIGDVVNAWAEVADAAAQIQPGFQCSLHNHFDSSCETADQMRMYLGALRRVNHPALRWGPDTGHCHGMGDQYLSIFKENADLIGNHFHIKARVAAFDALHGGADYKPERDIWGNKAEFGRGLYSGFVCCADPEIQTPFKEIFKIIKAKAKPNEKYITGAIEIDVPRQHPRLEILCSLLYLKHVHGLQPAQNLSYSAILDRIFKVKK